MTKYDITRMAKESGLLNPPQDGLDWSAPVPNSDYLQRLKRFAALVAQAERQLLTEEEILKYQQMVLRAHGIGSEE